VNISTVFEGDLVPILYKPPYTLDSTTRYSYQAPAVKSEMSRNLTRFGCNKKKYKPAIGAGMSLRRKGLAYTLPDFQLHVNIQNFTKSELKWGSKIIIDCSVA